MICSSLHSVIAVADSGWPSLFCILQHSREQLLYAVVGHVVTVSTRLSHDMSWQHVIGLRHHVLKFRSGCDAPDAEGSGQPSICFRRSSSLLYTSADRSCIPAFTTCVGKALPGSCRIPILSKIGYCGNALFRLVYTSCRTLQDCAR